MFFEFPGILITIGVILLLISIIIIIVAYRSDIKDVDASKLSTNNNNQENEDKTEQVEAKPEDKEIKIEEKEDKKELEKTKIFKPAEIMLEEKAISEDNKEERPMGLKDLLEDINKVDEKKDNIKEKEDTIDIFNEEFNETIKTEESKKDEKVEPEKTKPVIEEDEDIELL